MILKQLLRILETIKLLLRAATLIQNQIVQIKWNSILNNDTPITVTDSKGNTHTYGNDMDMLIRLVHAEGGHTGQEGATAVAEVVLNRLRNPKFNYKDKGLTAAIHTKGQFSVVTNGSIDKEISQEEYDKLYNWIKTAIEQKNRLC
jgi:spore germination cell wall hydrolase CwlJ-like protein